MDVKHVHEIGHVGKQFTVSLIITLVHQTAIAEHFRENAVLIDCTVLHASFTLPYDLLMLSKTFVQEVNLKRERIASHILVKSGHVRVRHVNHSFIVNRETCNNNTSTW